MLPLGYEYWNWWPRTWVTFAGLKGQVGRVCTLANPRFLYLRCYNVMKKKSKILIILMKGV